MTVAHGQPTEHSLNVAPPCVMVIFGASGDLTKRKLIPALYNLRHANLLSDNFAVIGVARAEMNDQEFRRRLKDDMNEFATDQIDESDWKWLEERLYYQSGDFNDAEAYTRLKTTIEKVDQEHGRSRNYLFYLATAPNYFAAVVERLGEAGLTKEDENQWRRAVIEKPFGRDLASAQQLNRDLEQRIKERTADLTRLNAELAEANRAKDVFLATLSHELRTPLTPVVGWIKLLRSGTLDEKSVSQALDAIERNAWLQSRLIDDLLDTSRIATGKLHFEPKPTDLNVVVKAAVDTVRNSAAARNERVAHERQSRQSEQRWKRSCRAIAG